MQEGHVRQIAVRFPRFDEIRFIETEEILRGATDLSNLWLPSLGGGMVLNPLILRAPQETQKHP